MKKIAYLSVFRDGSGYSHQSVHNMLALEAGGIDVVARAIKLSPTSNDDLASKVAHLENKTTDNVDVVIQHILPHQFEYKAGVKNIGLMCWETTNFRRSSWGHCCNLMDEVWVPSTQNKQALLDSSVSVPIKILPCACSVDRFNHKPEALKIDATNNKCAFYFVGEMTRRKNIVAILRSFYTAFSSRDDVVLVIKTNIPGKTPEETLQVLRTTIDDIKKSMHIYIQHSYYPPVACITDFLPDSKLDRLHAACDVFVSPSHGEAWGIPAHDAMGFGNPVILSNWGSFPELTYSKAVDNWQPDSLQFKFNKELDCGWMIKGQITSCFGQTESFPDLYTGDSFWYDPDIKHMGLCMKEAYTEWKNGILDKRGNAAKKRAAEFSYEKVGKIAKELLGI